MIPTPAFIRLDVVEEDIITRTLELLKLLPNQKLPVVIRHIDMHLLARNDLANDRRQILRHGPILPRKRNPLRSRPTKPRGAMWMPFRGKGVTERGGRVLKNSQ